MSDPKTTGAAAGAMARPMGGGAQSPFRSVQEEMERMVNALVSPHMSWRAGPVSSGAIGLRVDIAETDGEIQVTADLPGIDESDLDITLDDDVLRIRAEKKSEEESTDKEWHVVERSYGRFERAIRVPVGIDPAKVSARFAKGVLTVSLPKPPETTPKAQRIAVSGR